jgi:hypothetical protein
MIALLSLVSQTSTVRSGVAGAPVTNGCAQDCVYEYLCDSSHRYYRRQCCYRPDCTYHCGAWEAYGSC